MKIIDYIEQEDGSAIMTFETTPEETKFFVSYAVLDILTKQIERMENEDNICSPISE